MNIEKTKGILQAQSGILEEMDAALMMEAQRAPKVPDAAAIEPKNPGFLSETYSIINTPLPMHSPPVQTPWMIRRQAKSKGERIPRTEYEGNNPTQKVLRAIPSKEKDRAIRPYVSPIYPK